MSTAAFLFVITVVNTFIVSISGAFQSCITCPCGSSNQNYTHCLNELILRNLTCERWSQCQTCKANTAFCITCQPGHFGPTCSESENIRRKRQDDPDLLNHARYPRQSGSDRRSEARCLNHGHIPHGRVLVIPPFDDSQTDDDFDFPYGTILKFICDDGFVLVGKDTLRCTSKHFWNEDIPKCVRDTSTPQKSCKHPGVDVNGRINSPHVDSQRRRQEFPSGSELTFVCNDGFEPEGATVLACLGNGQWSSLPPKCRHSSEEEVSPAYCKHPGIIENGVIEDYESDSEQFPVGSELRFLCREGFQREGPDAIYCLRNLSWSEDPPICTRRSDIVVELPCRHPGVVVNSMFNEDLYQVSSFPIGTAVTFRCIEGTRRRGPMTIFCQSNGKWSEPPPTCEPSYKKR